MVRNLIDACESIRPSTDLSPPAFVMPSPAWKRPHEGTRPMLDGHAEKNGRALASLIQELTSCLRLVPKLHVSVGERQHKLLAFKSGVVSAFNTQLNLAEVVNTGYEDDWDNYRVP